MDSSSQAAIASTAFHELSGADRDLSEAGFHELLEVAERVASSQHNAAFVEEIGLDDPSELLSELVASHKLPQVVQTSPDAAIFTRKLYTALRNVLIDLHRRTDAGALARRIADALRRSDRYTRIEGGEDEGKWCASTTPASATGQVDTNKLVNAVWQIAVGSVVEWQGGRRTPVCSDADLRRLLDALFLTAQAPLELSAIVEAIQHRFSLLPNAPVALGLDLHAGPLRASAEASALDRLEAQQVWMLLSAEERLILTSRGLTARELAQILGCGASTAAKKIRKLAAALDGLGWTASDDSPSSTDAASMGGDIE